MAKNIIKVKGIECEYEGMTLKQLARLECMLSLSVDACLLSEESENNSPAIAGSNVI